MRLTEFESQAYRAGHMKAVAFIEENDWEGETWSFYISLEGNEDAIERLADLVADLEQFDVSDPMSRDDAEVLCRHSKTGYMDFHTQCLDLQLDIDSLEEHCESSSAEDILYKGGIEEYLVSRD